MVASSASSMVLQKVAWKAVKTAVSRVETKVLMRVANLAAWMVASKAAMMAGRTVASKVEMRVARRAVTMVDK